MLHSTGLQSQTWLSGWTELNWILAPYFNPVKSTLPINTRIILPRFIFYDISLLREYIELLLTWESQQSFIITCRVHSYMASVHPSSYSPKEPCIPATLIYLMFHKDICFKHLCPSVVLEISFSLLNPNHTENSFFINVGKPLVMKTELRIWKYTLTPCTLFSRPHT